MQTRNQKLALRVFERVAPLADHSERKKYGAMAHKLPVLILTAGLAQALGFVEAKAQSATGAMNRQLLEDLAHTLKYNNRAELLARSRQAELSEYLRLTQHALAALLWYKRFAQSVLGVEAGEGDEK